MDNQNRENVADKSGGRKLVMVFISVICALVIAAGAFVGGFFTGKSTLSPAARSLDWAIKLILENYVGGEVSEEQLRETPLKALGSLLDRYSAYYTAEEYSGVLAENSGSMLGIGVTVTYLEEGVSDLGDGLYIMGVSGNSPAFRAGVRAGTFITGAKSGDTQADFSSSADFTDFMSGIPENQDFTLITDKGEYTLARAAYTASYCSMATSTADYSVMYENGVMSVEDSDGGISALPADAAYIRLSQFYGNAVQEFCELVTEFNALDCKSLILDLRGNGGGYLDVMCGISGIFLGQLPQASSVATTAVYKDGHSKNYNVVKQDKDSTLPADTKVYVLADNGTASASEALIGVLVSGGVVGYEDIYVSDFSDDYLAWSGTAAKDCRTYGKGIMQQTYVHTTGEALKLTVAKIYWPNNVCIHDRGITLEDGCRALPAYWNVTYGDEQLSNAITAIYGGGNADLRR